MSALAMAIFLRGMDRTEIERWTARDDRVAGAAGLLLPVPTDRRQALHGGVGDKITLPLAPLVAAAAWPCRSSRAAGSATPEAPSTSSSRCRAGARRHQREMQAPARGRRRGHLRRGLRPRPGGQAALRPARRHRHGRVDPAHRQLDHEQEDRGGHRRAGPRRQGRLGCLHEGRRDGAGSWPARWSRSARTPACAPSRCSPTCPPRWGSPPATRSRCASRSRCSRGRSRRRRRAHRALAREMVDRRPAWTTSTRPTARDGPAIDVWRGCCAPRAVTRRRPPTARETRGGHRPRVGVLTRLDARAVGVAAWRLGAGVPGRRSRSRPEPASSCTPSPGQGARGERCSRCTPTHPTVRACAGRAGGLLRHRPRRRRVHPADPHRAGPHRLMAADDRCAGSHRASTAAPQGAAPRPPRRRSATCHRRRAGRRDRLRRPAERRRRRARPLVPRGRRLRLAGALPGDLRAHGRGHADPGAASAGSPRECAEDLAADGVVYAEVRYAPELHIEGGLTLTEVVEAVLDGLPRG